METMFPYPPVLAAAIFVVELLLRFAVKRGFIKDDIWFMKLLFRLILPVQ